MLIPARAQKFAALVTAFLWPATVYAANDPSGLWFDHNGRGAVEIKECTSGRGFCGHVVHIKNPKNSSKCGLQILGNVTQSGGWIYSPDRGRKYDVELTRLSEDKLRVLGNAGSRFFSRTFTWKRAPDDLARCDGATVVAPASVIPTATKPASPAAISPSAPIATSGAAALMAVTKPAATPPTITETKQDIKTPDMPAVSDESYDDSVGTSRKSSRKCKYRIPYVGRTVSVPCRD